MSVTYVELYNDLPKNNSGKQYGHNYIFTITICRFNLFVCLEIVPFQPISEIHDVLKTINTN